ncbi:MAG: putative addiction module antidote protein [Pseudomonadota bacterium]|nr:putative addiction module antidote protein [Pseudomonadota bacterium]
MKAETTLFDAAEYLDSEKVITEYIKAAIEENDTDTLLSALADVAKARGMAQVAEASGLGRESLYKALRPGAKPGFATISKVIKSLGVKLTVEPLPRA